MTKDEIIRRIERFDIPHSRRVLKQFSEECLTQYFDYLTCRRQESATGRQNRSPGERMRNPGSRCAAHHGGVI